MKKIGVVAILICLMLITGCDGAKETISQMRAELKQDILQEENAGEQAKQETAEPSREREINIPDAKDITIEETYRTVQTVAQSNGEEMTVQLYFASSDGKNLVKQEKKIPKAEGIARATMENLLLGPDEASGLKSAVPSGTELLDINIKIDEKLCIIDLSAEFSKSTTASAADLAVYAVVDTLCQFETVDKVEIRVEGENISSVGGNIDLRKTVKADKTMVK